MKRNLLFTALLMASLASPAFAHDQGTMGGYGQGQGMGPGAMGGYGQNYGMGPGMMGSQGYGQGQGMMGGYGQGYGMGPGMMGGYGYGQGQGMGPGMMGTPFSGGYGFRGIKLSEDQQEKITDIQEEVGQKRWELMSTMQAQQHRMQELYSQGKEDDAAARKLFETMAGMQKQMFELSASARKRIDAVLTKEQRDKLRKSRGAALGK